MIKFANQGLYTLPQAGRLLGERAATVERWAFGYERRGAAYEPPIRTEVPALEGVKVITFLELVELMFIRGLLAAGLSWKRVRTAAATATRLLHDVPHPFAMRKWFADPAGVYLQLGEEHGEPILVELAGDAQVALGKVLDPYLQQIEFDIDGVAHRWYPLGFDRPVVVDPRRALGAAIIPSGGVPTDVLLEMHRAGDSVPSIAAWYGLEEYEVAAALEFEEGLRR
ncbi:MAG: DUF433 domain-containing protein [Gemmatimonadota bacterium]